ncbi:hypothetical protein J5226_09565 [Lysobacter sp. K5869]|uniref:hypothetical protein n=1 Tax=Lysobacter sp. K5869 TaxID=2820808 RepID=UPI001C060F5F|nr:hypothetical protein [Lysobacter sp. K5869]QWP78617.1 hypothetical protein J5226_09565 [Lysobacter sp. K5869]
MRRIAPTSPVSRRRGIALAAAVATVALALPGCGAVRTIAGINTVHLEQARIESMQIDLADGAASVCPRQRVQMHAVVAAQLPKQPAPLLYETWRGANGTRRNGMLDFRNFAFSSQQGRFDELGWFEPNPDVLASLDSGFAISASLVHPTAQFARTAHYPASYDCIDRIGAAAGPGIDGRDGGYGERGRDGYDGAHGGRGEYGRNGGDGEPGGDGYGGMHVRAYATYVATARYPRLLAVRLEGDVEDFVLAPPDRAFVVVAAGGRGGQGGDGGSGGAGGDGGDGNKDKDRPGYGGEGGDGGDGGYGAPGGRGGDGGQIELIYDRRFPELAGWLRMDASGGSGGDGGSAGASGSGGDGGDGGSGSGRDGRSGNYGSSGPTGLRGRDGFARMQAGDVAERFRDLPGVRAL